MTRSPNKSCGYCGQPLQEDRARFEVRVAPDYQPRPEAAEGTYCGSFCWEAAKTVKSVDSVIKSYHQDCETVLSDEGKLLRR